MLIDLQVHSIYSDGYLKPRELVDFLAREGVKVASLTDHNTLVGFEEFAQACQKAKIKAVPGIEIYTRFNNRQINVLWYNLPVDNEKVNKLLLNSQKHWENRLRQHLHKMVAKKMLVKGSEKIVDQFTNYIPTNRILDALLAIKGNRQLIEKATGEKNFREEEAIGWLFNNKKIGKLKPSCIDLKRIIKLRQELGGQLVFCHPGKSRFLKTKLVVKLKELGIDGLEVLSPHHSLGTVFYLQDLANRLNMIMTGGSDFHRFEMVDRGLLSAYDYWRADSCDLRDIGEVIGQ